MPVKLITKKWNRKPHHLAFSSTLDSIRNRDDFWKTINVKRSKPQTSMIHDNWYVNDTLIWIIPSLSLAPPAFSVGGFSFSIYTHFSPVDWSMKLQPHLHTHSIAATAEWRNDMNAEYERQTERDSCVCVHIFPARMCLHACGLPNRLWALEIIIINLGLTCE